jgi:CRISPR/Cas system CSM-associated protein Csm5 (group 7 of RAMP superfamily)
MSRIDEQYLTRLIDDLQTAETEVFNKLKQPPTKANEIFKLGKLLEKQSKLLNSMKHSAVTLKSILPRIKEAESSK